MNVTDSVSANPDRLVAAACGDPIAPASWGWMREWALTLTLALAMAPALEAAESRMGVPLPGLQSDPPDTVAPEDCAVSLVDGRVSVDMSVSTVEEKPALLFEGPLFGWNGPSEPYPDRQFPELHLRVDGDPSKPTETFEVFVGKRNISMLIKMAGMDPWAITRTPPLTAAHPQHVQVLQVLNDLGAVDPSGNDFLAKWQARRILRISLKSIPAQHVQFDYTARPAMSIISAATLDSASREHRYCISPGLLRRLIHRGPDLSSLTVSEFTVPTGIDGKPPQSVTVTMSAGPGADAGPRAYWFLCGLHGKPIARRGSVNRERADVDDSGAVHVLRVVEPVNSRPGGARANPGARLTADNSPARVR
jgi:hypothetical protein